MWAKDLQTARNERVQVGEYTRYIINERKTKTSGTPIYTRKLGPCALAGSKMHLYEVLSSMSTCIIVAGKKVLDDLFC